jgi:hypothetical protein
MEVKISNKQKKEMAFRIVKDRWYHRTFDRITNRFHGKKIQDTPAYYQIHLSAELKKRKNKWVLANQKNIKTTSILPEASFQRRFAMQNENHSFENISFDVENIAPFGFEIDMSHVKALEENLVREIKNEKGNTEEKVETKENSVNETMSPNSITDLSDIPIDVLLKMCSDPEMLELVLKLDPSLDVLEAMVYEILEKIQMLKEEKFLKEKEKLSAEEKGEKSPPEYIYP